ncbi:major facilitator superfamily domain-containing protein [Mycena leptocephala]|nr:major facilitator superfamily domain-containing protein [Mycena leptocephala]
MSDPAFSPLIPSSSEKDRIEYPTGVKLGLISLALCLSMFLVAWCATSLSPKITDQFHSLDDIGWWSLNFSVYISAIGIFELGSLICAVAPSSMALIIGRAVAGIGSSGLGAGTLIICANAVPLEQRSMYMGLIAAVYWVGSVVGPLIGGALTENCFWINIPAGAVTVIVIAIFFKAPGISHEARSVPIAKRIQQLDPWGTLVFIPAIVCLLLALQLGGSKYSWGNGRIIALLVLFCVLIAAFVGIQVWKQDDATVPPRIFNRRGIMAAAWFSLCFSGSFITLVYLLPIYFQAIKGVSAVESGIQNLPLVLSVVTSSLIAGGIITAIGYYTPFMILASILTSVGAGLLSTFTVHTGHAHWIGYQVIFGLGVGAGIQQPLLVVQAVLDAPDVSIGTSLILFMQTLGGAVFVSVGQNVFRSRLLSGLTSRVPGVDPAVILNSGATGLRGAVETKFLPEVLAVYNDALVSAIYVCVAMAALSMVGSLATEWRSVKASKVSSAETG